MQEFDLAFSDIELDLAFSDIEFNFDFFRSFSFQTMGGNPSSETGNTEAEQAKPTVLLSGRSSGEAKDLPGPPGNLITEVFHDKNKEIVAATSSGDKGHITKVSTAKLTQGTASCDITGSKATSAATKLDSHAYALAKEGTRSEVTTTKLDNTYHASAKVEQLPSAELDKVRETNSARKEIPGQETAIVYREDLGYGTRATITDPILKDKDKAKGGFELMSHYQEDSDTKKS